jgi:hypothetical protein
MNAIMAEVCDHHGLAVTTLVSLFTGMPCRARALTRRRIATGRCSIERRRAPHAP